MNRRLLRYAGSPAIVAFSVVLMFLTAGVGVSASTPNKHSKPMNVGMIALLAAPQNYNGKIIRTIGFLHIGRMREDDSLWLHEEDGQFSLYKNSFALDLSDDQRKEFAPLNHTYVLVTGTLHSDGPEGDKMSSGEITHIRQMDGWSPYHPSSPAKE